VPIARKFQCCIGSQELEMSYWIRDGDGEWVIFIHGLGCSKDSFLPAFENNYFAQRYSLIAIDLLGHGDSSKPRDFSYTLEQQVEVLGGFLRDIQPGVVNIVAHSMGGAVALLLMEQMTNVNNFFCLEGNLVSEDCKISLRVAALDERKFVDKIHPIAPLQFRCMGLASEPAASPQAFYRSAKSLVKLSTSGCLLKLYKETNTTNTYIYGERNNQIPVLNELQGLERKEIPDSGHFMMLENPHETYREITRRL